MKYTAVIQVPKHSPHGEIGFEELRREDHCVTYLFYKTDIDTHIEQGHSVASRLHSLVTRYKADRIELRLDGTEHEMIIDEMGVHEYRGDSGPKRLEFLTEAIAIATHLNYDTDELKQRWMDQLKDLAQF